MCVRYNQLNNAKKLTCSKALSPRVTIMFLQSLPVTFDTSHYNIPSGVARGRGVGKTGAMLKNLGRRKVFTRAHCINRNNISFSSFFLFTQVLCSTPHAK